MIYCLEVEAVIALNSKHTDNGGVLRDRAALESALARPMQSSYGQDFYPTVIDKAAVLLRGIAANHAFLDGNKRTAWLACVVFLNGQGVRLAGEANGYADDFVVAVATGDLDQAAVVEWLLGRIDDTDE